MRKLPLGLGALAAVTLLAFGVTAIAQEKKPLKSGPACNAISTQATCEARGDCQWVAASMDKDGKQKRKAYCRAKPKEPDKK